MTVKTPKSLGSGRDHNEQGEAMVRKMESEKGV